MIGDLQKNRPSAARHAGERADDQIVDEPPQVVRTCAAAGVGIKNLKKMPELFRFGLDAKLLVSLQRRVIERDVVVGRDRIESQVRAKCSLRFGRIDLAAL